MFRPALNAAKRSAVRSARQIRLNSSKASTAGGDTKWAIGSVAVTVPALAYLLAPPEKKGDAHKVLHATAAQVGIKTEDPEEAEDAQPDERNGPDSRSPNPEQSQSPESKREQSASTVAGKDINGDDKAGREPGATQPSGGEIGSKQSGLSNTETKHMVPGVQKEGQGQSVKSSNTIEPRNARGKEKAGPDAEDPQTRPAGETPEPVKDTDVRYEVLP